jgi:hypothetical protein
MGTSPGKYSILGQKRLWYGPRPEKGVCHFFLKSSFEEICAVRCIKLGKRMKKCSMLQKDVDKEIIVQ